MREFDCDPILLTSKSNVINYQGVLNGSWMTTGTRRRQSTKHLGETRKHTNNDRWVPLGFASGAVTSLSLSPLRSPVVSQDCSCFGCFRNQVSLQCQGRMNHVASPDKKGKKKKKTKSWVFSVWHRAFHHVRVNTVLQMACVCVWRVGWGACVHACVSACVCRRAFHHVPINSATWWVSERERRENSNSNSKTLFSKDCSLGSFRPV